jgi:hypothetical protein
MDDDDDDDRKRRARSWDGNLPSSSGSRTTLRCQKVASWMALIEKGKVLSLPSRGYDVRAVFVNLDVRRMPPCLLALEVAGT